MSARLSGSYLRDQPLLRLISFGRAIDPVMIGGTEFAHEEAGFLLLGHVLAVVAGLVDQRVLVVLRGVVRLVHRPVGFRPGCRGLGVGRGVGARRLDGHGGPGPPGPPGPPPVGPAAALPAVAKVVAPCCATADCAVFVAARMPK